VGPAPPKVLSGGQSLTHTTANPDAGMTTEAPKGQVETPTVARSALPQLFRWRRDRQFESVFLQQRVRNFQSRSDKRAPMSRVNSCNSARYPLPPPPKNTRHRRRQRRRRAGR
jgi:hypothetical protein